MTNQKRSYQFARPVVVSSLDDQTAAQPLERVRIAPGGGDAGGKYNESWLQQLVHRHPSSLPIAELEPGLGRIVPVGMELQTPAGFIDNLFVTQEGDLVVVECKLWRNTEARRMVLAQIIDYAQSMQKWSYDDLERAIKTSRGGDGKPVEKTLIDIIRNCVGDPDEVDESSFVDAVQKNLRLGRMLLLVVGDGIREDAESLANYLQQHAGFHFTLGLVETAVYKLPSNDYLVQPRVLARTLNIERAIVTISGSAVAAQAVVTPAQTRRVVMAMSLTEETFFEKLEEADPPAANALKAFLTRTIELGVFLDVATKSATLKWESAHGKLYSLGGVDLQGRLSTYSVCWAPSTVGRVDLAHEYLGDVSKLVGGQVRETKTQENWYVVVNGTTTLPPAIDALKRPDEWSDAIAKYQKRINDAEGDE